MPKFIPKKKKLIVDVDYFESWRKENEKQLNKDFGKLKKENKDDKNFWDKLCVFVFLMNTQDVTDEEYENGEIIYK